MTRLQNFKHHLADRLSLLMDQHPMAAFGLIGLCLPMGLILSVSAVTGLFALPMGLLMGWL